jgi:hypothetical protein
MPGQRGLIHGRPLLAIHVFRTADTFSPSPPTAKLFLPLCVHRSHLRLTRLLIHVRNQLRKTAHDFLAVGNALSSDLRQGKGRK